MKVTEKLADLRYIRNVDREKLLDQGLEPDLGGGVVKVEEKDEVYISPIQDELEMDETLENVVVIPRKAISELQGLFRVYVVDAAGQVAVKQITLGPKTGDDVVVEAGLDAGETVIVEGIQKVRPGMTVEPVPAGSTAAAQE